jgi:nanoRNase/pAp phosphatase (c-di-AMP/oligoRNAs hydrolase)
MKSTLDQVIDTLKGSRKVLLTTRADAHEDSIASCLAMYLLLQKMGVPADIVLPNSDHKLDRCAFLPHVETIKDTSRLKQLVVSIPNVGNIADFRYEIEDDKLKIYVTTKDDKFKVDEIEANTGVLDHDVIVVCDSPDLQQLGTFYTEHAEFFYHTPIINIDHNPANEQYGQINCVDVTAVSTTEVIVKMFNELLDTHLDPDIATVLLTGMIAKTRSFQTGNTTPQALRTASDLVERGARRDEIIQHLYRQHKLHTLRLWGRVLTRIEHLADGVVYSHVYREDFTESGAGEDDIPGIIDELLSTSPDARRVVLLYEKESGKVGGWLKTEPHTDAEQMTLAWQGVGSRSLANFQVEADTVEDARQQISELLEIK